VTGTSLVVTPNATTTYTLTASGTGSVTSTVTVTVQALPTLTWVKTLVYGFGALLSEEKASDTFYMQGDQVGSPSIITDRLGAVMGRSKNLPFGERFGQTGEKSTRRYTNHEDQEGSAIYMQARTYLPAYGKFAQVDPAYDQLKDDPETWNLYNYVTNNPATHTDPDGRRAAIDHYYQSSGTPANWLAWEDSCFGYDGGFTMPSGYAEVWSTVVGGWYLDNGRPYNEPKSQTGDDALSRTANKDQINRINGLINSGDAMRAIHAALAAWGIDTSNVKYIIYDPNCTDYANTSKRGVVTVGPAALGDAGLLGTTLAHEIEVHLNIQAAGGTWHKSSMGRNLNEVQAWDYELKNSSRFGLSSDQISEIQQARTDYYNQLNSYYQQRVNAGNYAMSFGSDFWYWVRKK